MSSIIKLGKFDILFEIIYIGLWNTSFWSSSYPNLVSFRKDQITYL